MPTFHAFPATVGEARRALVNAYDTVRAHVRKLGDSARQTFDRVGTAVERYAAAKIERKVKPPILAALVAAGAALVVALVAVFRK